MLPRSTTLLAAWFWVCAAVHVFKIGSDFVAIDFYQYWAAARAVREHTVPNVYADEGRRELARVAVARAVLPTASETERVALDANLKGYGGSLMIVGTPALHMALSPFVGDDYEVDRKTFLAAQLAAVAAASVVSAVAVGLPAAVGWLFAGWALLFFQPVMANLIIGNIGAFQWLWLGVVALIGRSERGAQRDVLVGGSLGVALAIKPNLLVLVAVVVLPLVVDRRVRSVARTVAGVLGGAAATMGVSALWSGWSAWGQWAALLRRLGDSRTLAEGNAGVVAAVTLLTHHELPRLLTLMAAAGLVGVLVTSRAPDREPMPDEVLYGIAAGAGATTMCAPTYWLHYATLLVPAAMLGWRDGARGWVILALVLLSNPLRAFLDDPQVNLAAYAVGELALFVAALVAWRRARLCLLATPQPR